MNIIDKHHWILQEPVFILVEIAVESACQAAKTWEVRNEMVKSLGYLDVVLMFVTFYMKTMLPLRYTALCSNVAFIIHGYFSHLYPALFLHYCYSP